MLWARKRRAEAPAASADEIIPAELPIALDAGLFTHHFAQLLETAAPCGGIQACLERLGVKQRLYAELLGEARGQELGMEAIERLLGYAFTARRHLMPAFEALGASECARLVSHLKGRDMPLARRLQDFVDAMPGARTQDRAEVRAAARLRRAAWDFAAELVHFDDPASYPLMSRWVWDRASQSGALREFIRGGDARTEIPFDGSAEFFEGARKWLTDRIAGEGIYRDVPLWIDLVLAQAYTAYVRSMANGSLGGEFGRGATAYEQLAKLLGIDAPPEGARSRVRKAMV